MGSQSAADGGRAREPAQGTDDLDIPLEAGATVDGRYRIIDVLGMGGVGVVYEAEHLGLKRAVALKVLRKSFVEHVSLRPRFEREARALSAMAHPNIVAVMDYAIADEGPYLVMELLAGRTLRTLMDEGPVPTAYALRISRALLRGLGYAHGRGLVHRDIKPGNVFLQSLDAQGEYVKLLDFGFAKISPDSELTTGSMISSVDETFGTPAYMAPEQAMGDHVDLRADLYSVGILLFEMLAGAKPFDGEVHEIINAHLAAPVPALEEFRADVRATPEMVAFLERALAKDPAGRFASADDMAAGIEDLPRESLVPRGPEHAARAALGARQAPAMAEPPRVAKGVQSARKPDPAVPDGIRVAGPPPSRRTAVAVAAVVLIGAAGLGLLWQGTADRDGGNEAPTTLSPGRSPVTAAPGADRAFASGPSTEGRDPVPRSDDGREDGAGGDGNAEAAEAAEAATTAALPPGREAPLAPWDLHPPVPLLEATRAKLDGGDIPPPEAIGQLRAYSRGNRADPRPHLLLGRIFLAREWWSDALMRFSISYAVDPRFGADGDLRAGLEALAARPEFAGEAQALLEGAEAPGPTGAAP